MIWEIFLPENVTLSSSTKSCYLQSELTVTTIDTLFGKRFYLFIILELRSRRIIRFDLSENSCREFVKQRIALFSEDFSDKKILIHDNAGQFTSMDFSWFEIKGTIPALMPQSLVESQLSARPCFPGMKAFVERLNCSIRREALDQFLLFSEKQIRKIIRDYVLYYNHQRPHQGICKIPSRNQISGIGIIRKEPVLGGLHHSYYRSSA